MVLLTGGSGFLGEIIYEQFSSCSRLSRSKSSDLCFDLSKEIPILSKYSLVIHSAGKAHSLPKTKLEKDEFYNVNVLGTLNLLKGLEKSGLPKNFVFISSVSVYGKEIGEDISEDYPLLAKDPYGLSKIKAEEIIEKWCNDNQVICTILRLPLLVGKNPPGNLGAMVKAIRKGYYFNIGGGKAKKSMILGKDVASFIKIAAPVGGIYNITDGVHPDFDQLSLMISKNKRQQFNLPLAVALFLGKIGDVLGKRFPVNSSKIKKITSDLTFNDSKARALEWNSQSVLEYLEKHSID